MPSTPRLTANSIEVPGALEAFETYFENGWSDGLPVVPPTLMGFNRTWAKF